MTIDDDELLPEIKPVIWQCACGKWQVQVVLLVGGTIYGVETFASREEAALVLADRIIELGIDTRRVG